MNLLIGVNIQTLQQRIQTLSITLWVLLLYLSTGFCESNNLLTIQGQVTDEQNNVLTDYIISAESQNHNITYSSKTNFRGEFSLKNLPADTCIVSVRHLSTLLTQQEVTLTEKSLVSVNFVIKGTSSISGFLLDSVNNLPLQITGEIQIALLKEDEWVERIYKGKVSNGFFKVNNLLSGRYSIIDAFDGFVFASSDSPILTVYPDIHIGGVEVLLKPGANVFGRFVDDENGKPISKVLVGVGSVKRSSIYAEGTSIHETESNVTGEFRLTTPNDPETYSAFTVIASHPYYQTNRWRWDLLPNKTEYTLGTLQLKPFLSLQGRVSKSKSYHSVGGLEVHLKMHNKSGDFFRAAAQPERTALTDIDGTFLFTELHPIDYSLTISRNDLILASIESVNPQSNIPLNIHLPMLKTLHGKVIDEQQRPIEDARLYVILKNENPYGHNVILAMKHTDANGLFQMQVMETKPYLLSLDVSKGGYLSRVYPNVKLRSEPLVVTLPKGLSIKGRVILPSEIPSDGYYDIKIFPENVKMEPTLNTLALNRPLLTKRFPISDETFEINGLFDEKYILYVTGKGIETTEMKVTATDEDQYMLIVVENPTVELNGQVLWADTSEPVQNTLVSRSWYPWELSPYDMSLTLDRFETETDSQGRFTFPDLTQGRYQLHIRVVQTVFDTDTEKNKRLHIHKSVEIPVICDETYHIYLGKADGTPFVDASN